MLKWGNYSEAYRYAQISVGAARDYGNPNFVAYAQLALARAEKAQGERAEALGLVEEVLVQARAKKWLDIEGQVEYLRGELMRELGYPEEAEPSARRALVLSQELQLREHEVKSCLSWGQALSALGRRDEARDALQKARRISAERDYEDHFHKAEELLAEL
jgi:tetratricopeptide (TPR) repeat protein